MSGKKALRLGFIPLIDAAIPLVAADMGFASARGLELVPMRETSWANIRDRIAIGHFEVAQLLAPMPIAANLGLTPFEAPLVAPLALGPGANAITVSSALHAAMREAMPEMVINDAASTGAALRKVVAKDGARRLNFAVVHPYSAQNYVLRYWLAGCGIAPDTEIDIGVLPPPLMPDALKSGMIDGFCVGEPWNTRTAYRAEGRIILSKAAIWREGSEKVLGLRRDFAQNNPEILRELLLAMEDAARWCRDPANRSALIDLLSQSNRLDLPASEIGAAITGAVPMADGRALALDPFGNEAALKPDPGAALWFLEQMARWGQAPLNAHTRALAAQSYGSTPPAQMTGEPFRPAGGFFDR